MQTQFSLRFLFQAMTTIALLCGAALIMPSWFTQLVVGALWIVASGIFLTGLVFARGDQQAFCLGVTIGLSSMWFGPGGRFMAGVHSVVELFFSALGIQLSNDLLAWLDVVVLSVLAWGMGRLCVAAKRYFEARA